MLRERSESFFFSVFLCIVTIDCFLGFNNALAQTIVLQITVYVEQEIIPVFFFFYSTLRLYILTDSFGSDVWD